MEVIGSDITWSRSDLVGVGEAGGGTTMDVRYVPPGERVGALGEMGCVGSGTAGGNWGEGGGGVVST